MQKESRILIVEDNRETSRLIRSYLHDLGYTVASSVTTGEEAIEFSKKTKPDIILMDITLEGEMDGIESARYIYENFKIPVIYITYSSEESVLKRIRTTNPFGYIIKPVDKNELKAAIEMAFMKYSMEKMLKDEEEKYSGILKSISDAVIVADHEGMITYMNPVAEEMTGCIKESSIGSNLNTIIKIEHMNRHQSETEIHHNDKYREYLISATGIKVPIDYRTSPQLDTTGNLIGTVTVFRDISESIKSEDNLHESLKKLRKAMGGVIQAMAYTVETRDPYTAGHQKKVANLARLIANKMNLPYDTIDGIRMAGVIHDLGKISIPAEILSKPGKITDIEFNLIKHHPQVGFDILKSIEFPWPIAEIVFQHHERLDGSGYPMGLTGDKIRLESKIISVADVVEAMASHRPYRASLGIELALSEISKNSGKYYDDDVVKSCIALFREDGYSFNNL